MNSGDLAASFVLGAHLCWFNCTKK